MSVVTWAEDVDLTKSNLPERLQKCVGAAIVTESSGPFEIIACNSAWSQLCGYQPEEALGKGPGSLLQGPQTNLKKASTFSKELAIAGEASSTLVNYTKLGRPFVHCLHTTTVVDEVTGKRYFLTESKEEQRASIRNALLKPMSNFTYTSVHLLLALFCIATTFGVARFASDEQSQYRPLASERIFAEINTAAHIYPSYTYGDIYF